METPNFTTPGHNIPMVYTVSQVLRSCATSKPCFLVSNYKLSASKPFSVYIFAVPSTCAKDRMPSLIPVGFLEEVSMLFSSLLSALFFSPPTPHLQFIASGFYLQQTETDSNKKKITLISRPLPLLTGTL